jgi:hypothetical protein
MRCAIAAVCVLAIAGSAIHRAPNVKASTGPIPLNCNRACLESVMDQYLAALVAHDPKRVPLSADVVYTENDQRLDVGDGFWKTVEGLGNYKHIFADPEFGQVALMGTMREAGANEAFLIENGKIRRVEMVGPSVPYHLNSGWPGGLSGN